jgi:hypothetical protein
MGPSQGQNFGPIFGAEIALQKLLCGCVKTVCAVRITYILKLKHFYSITRSINARFEPGHRLGLADYRYRQIDWQIFIRILFTGSLKRPHINLLANYKPFCK